MPKLIVLLFTVFICLTAQAQDWLKVYRVNQLDDHYYHNKHSRDFKNIPPSFLQKNQNITFNKKRFPYKPFNLEQQCYDTSLRLIYKNDTLWTYNDFITHTRDGNILIPGFDEHVAGDNFYALGHILKCTPKGDTVWYKKIASGYNHHFIDIYHAWELADNSIILAGDQDVPEPYNGKAVPLIIKLSSTGNLIWEKTYKSNYWNVDTTTGGVYFSDLKEDTNGELYFCGNIQYFDSEPRAAVILKTDGDGNPVWSKGFTIGAQISFGGVQIKNDSLQLLGHSYIDFGGRQVFGVSLNKNTGDTNYTKGWTMPYNSNDSYNAYTYVDNVTTSNNGNYYAYGSTLGDAYSFDVTKPKVHACILEFTPELDFVNSTLLESAQQSNGSNTVLTVFPDGSGAFSRLQYISGHTSNVLFGSFYKNQITKERVIHYSGRSNLWMSNFLNMGNGGLFVTQTIGDSVKNYVGIEIDKLHNSDTSAYCLGIDTAITQIVPGVPYSRINYFQFDSIKNKIFTVDNRAFGAILNGKIDIVSGCEAVSFCNSLKVKTSADTLCPLMPVLITVEKNKECGALPFWDYDSSVIKSFVAINDSTIQLIFKTPWQGRLTSFINGCSGYVSDSIKLTVLQAPSKLDIGPDTIICPGNTIILNAKSGYVSYKWQDDSGDSVYKVTKPGMYYVEVTNACGGIFYDTVFVKAHPPIQLNIGNDTSICSGDTLIIKAPSGFISYHWTPARNISDTSDQTVQLNPTSTTQYYLSAEKTKNCFAYDSVKIEIKEKPIVNIGNDTSFCKGDSLIIQANTGFKNYLWNNGSNEMSISVFNPGTYSVVVTSQNGCTASDTMHVLNVFKTPVVLLKKDSELCAGNLLQLDAGAGFTSYKWQDASTSQKYTVSSIGKYFVQVTDVNGCIGADTTVIRKINPLPLSFLVNDTVKCSFDTLTLQSRQLYNQYVWSTGSTTNYVKIVSPGTYWLQVTDSNNCTAKEFTRVTDKECYNVLYFPTAFTPNNDGLNDRFRPKVFGNLQEFHLVIYNRWGSKIFETTNWKEGWDGTVNSTLQNNDTFVWIANYKLTGLQSSTEKGLVTIVK